MFSVDGRLLTLHLRNAQAVLDSPLVVGRATGTNRAERRGRERATETERGRERTRERERERTRERERENGTPLVRIVERSALENRTLTDNAYGYSVPPDQPDTNVYSRGHRHWGQSEHFIIYHHILYRPLLVISSTPSSEQLSPPLSARTSALTVCHTRYPRSCHSDLHNCSQHCLYSTSRPVKINSAAFNSS